MKKNNYDILRKIIKEELEMMNEEVDHVSIRNVVNAASHLLKAIDSFEKSKATSQMISGTSNYLQKLRVSLEDMISNPTSYLEKNQSKVVTLRKVSKE